MLGGNGQWKCRKVRFDDVHLSVGLATLLVEESSLLCCLSTCVCELMIDRYFRLHNENLSFAKGVVKK